MIDLHMHTTASDGRLSPAELVARAAAAGLTTISVTDHDTVAAIESATAAAAPLGIRVISGIEVTAVDNFRDVHMLAYFIDPANRPLADLLVKQRALRVSRVTEIADRLATLNVPVDVDNLLLMAAAHPGSSVGRPQLARELVRAGHVQSVQEAFDKWLATGMPGFVPRTGPSPADVIDTIHAAGGIASFAHPGVTNRDDLIASLVDRGLDAIEVYHSDHTPEQVMGYRGLAMRHNLLVSGGSDFHGDDPQKPGERSHRSTLGAITLPPEALEALEATARRRQSPTTHQGSGGQGATRPEA
jgi:3',5'-nucleoside bisphosphate phosphatase